MCLCVCLAVSLREQGEQRRQAYTPTNYKDVAPPKGSWVRNVLRVLPCASCVSVGVVTARGPQA